MTAPLVVDVHAHAMPMPLLRRLAARGLADLSGVSRGVVVLDPAVSGVGPDTPLPLDAAQYDPASRLSAMDAAGVDVRVVSLPPFLLCSTAGDPRLARDVIGHGNDELAAYAARAPGRLLALGSVPLGLPGAAEEARRCLDRLGMAGLALGTRGAGRELDDPVNDELWALLAERRAFAFLHPSGVPDPHRQRDYWLPQLVGYPMETALAVARLVFGGVLERFAPRICLAHGGGCLPSLRGRLDLGWSRKPVARTTVLPPGELIGRLYYDTAVFSATALRRLVADVGAGHVLLGTDDPFELADRDPLGTVAALALGPGDAAAILGGTAAALLAIDTPIPGNRTLDKETRP
ncbi:aminocarboxymuconate-semialdehyde decarboxylase [Thermocatellispora tengchongensis]|uniref:Aminocarboxymuconate-semialdehyde decarboxylase n=1 Tax=Thermocatellispora tengchongensis TaxID=1073253 RepID=A0A840P8T8_9ACTN|nr:amidohydrolase family protein [Thermocatellispora tengchongensis]MBB5133627.1 aminocarboxymuconate-semialdehyde decarboxylase [Thermocatellispora tengchongensis]